MALSYQNYEPTDNITDTFQIPFTFQNTSEISVTVDGIAQTGLTFPSSSTVQLTSPVASGSLVQVRRTTDLTARAVDFASGSVLTEEDLDNSDIQTFHASQEAIDKANDSIFLDSDDKWEANSKVIKNLADPVANTDAVNKQFISTNLPNITTVAGIAQDVTDVAAIDTEIDILVNKYDGSTTATSGTNKNLTQVDAVADNVADINTVANAATDIGLLADLQDGTTATNALSNIAVRSADIEIVAHLEDGTTATNAISNLAARTTDIQTVAARDTDIGILADLEDGTTATNALSNLGGQSAKLDDIHDDLAEIVSVHSSLNNIDTLAPRSGDLALLGARATDIATLADVQDGTTATNALSNLGSLGQQLINLGSTTTSGHINTLGSLGTEIGEVAAIDTQVAQVAGIRNQIISIDSRKNQLVDATNSIYNKINELSTIYNNISDINSVADNINGITSFAQTYFSGATAPTGVTINAGDLWYDTTSTTMKVYNGSAWEAVATSTSGFAQLSGSTFTGDVTVPNLITAGNVDGRDVSADGTKLDGIEDNATADQTGAEIKSAYEAEADTNAFTDDEKTKLTGIETGADVTDATNVAAAGALMDSEVTNLAQVKAFDSADYATAAQGTLAANALPKSGGTMTGTLTLGSNVINDVEDIYLRDKLYHDGDTNTYLGFNSDRIDFYTGGFPNLSLFNTYIQAYENVVGSVHTDTNQGTGTHTPDFQNYNSFVWTLTGNITLGNPTTEIAGMSGVFIFTHSGGSHTVSPLSQYETIDGGALTLSGTAGAVDIVPYFVRSTGNIMLGKPLLNFVNAS